MEEIMFLLTLIGTIATVISTVISIRARMKLEGSWKKLNKMGIGMFKILVI